MVEPYTEEELKKIKGFLRDRGSVPSGAGVLKGSEAGRFERNDDSPYDLELDPKALDHDELEELYDEDEEYPV